MEREIGKVRNSNIELLRILAMCMIVCGHFIGQSGLHITGETPNAFVLLLMGSGARIATNVFLLVGVWFMLEAKFSAERILKMYGQVIFYCWPLTLISVIFWGDLCSMKDIARGVLPFLGRALWFASSYILLLLFAPLLNKILAWEKKTLAHFVFLLLFTVSFISTLPDRQDSFVLDTLWFPVVYLTLGYVKKYPWRIPFDNCLKLFGGGGIYFFLVTFVYLSKTHDRSGVLAAIAAVAQQYLGDIRTIPNFVCALLVFWYFISLPPRHCGLVNRIASFSFSVYIFHQVPAFFAGLWKFGFHTEIWAATPAAWYPPVVFLAIYLLVAAADTLRKKYVESLWLQNRWVRHVISKLDHAYASLH